MKPKKVNWKKATIIGWTLFCLLVGFTAANIFDPIPAPEAQTTSVMPAAPGSFSNLAEQASPSVVNIYTVKVIKGRGQTPLPFGPNDPLREFFERFFGDQPPRDFKQRSLGTGFIIDREGFVLTNNHVVEQSDEIKVKLSDESEFTAKIIARDPKTDLALIKIESDRTFRPLSFGDSDKLKVGDWVVAIGNPFGLGNTVTAGIVSAKYRQIGAGAYDNFIQTDASINPGNSGGPLLNTAGEVVGINTAIFSKSGGSVGIGFAIPINMAKDLLPQLKKGKIIRGWLGVMIQNISPELREKFNLKDEKGALIADVTSDGPADKAGLKRGDVIVSYEDREIRDSGDLAYSVAMTPVGKTVKVEIVRKGQIKSLIVAIGELKDQQEKPSTKPLEPQLGMTLKENTPDLARQYGLTETSGLVVLRVEPNTPAAEAGLRPGDVILEVEQEPVKDLRQFNQRISRLAEGTILLLVKRKSSTLFLTLNVSKK